MLDRSRCCVPWRWGAAAAASLGGRSAAAAASVRGRSAAAAASGGRSAAAAASLGDRAQPLLCPSWTEHGHCRFRRGRARPLPLPSGAERGRCCVPRGRSAAAAAFFGDKVRPRSLFGLRRYRRRREPLPAFVVFRRLHRLRRCPVFESFSPVPLSSGDAGIFGAFAVSGRCSRCQGKTATSADNFVLLEFFGRHWRCQWTLSRDGAVPERPLPLFLGDGALATTASLGDADAATAEAAATGVSSWGQRTFSSYSRSSGGARGAGGRSHSGTEPRPLVCPLGDGAAATAVSLRD